MENKNLKAQKQKKIITGSRMGGLVTRYFVAKIEKSRCTHLCKKPNKTDSIVIFIIFTLSQAWAGGGGDD